MIIEKVERYKDIDGNVTHYKVNDMYFVPNDKENGIYQLVQKFGESKKNKIIDVQKQKKSKEKIKRERYDLLEQIFSEKWIGLQYYIIGKEWGQNKEYITAQTQSFKSLAEHAKVILESNPDDARAKSIVAKYNYSLEKTYQINLLIQTLRGVLEDRIEEDDENVDKMLIYAKKFKLGKDVEITDEFIADVMSNFIGDNNG